ncbi:uncharacterized protein LOC133408737 isoform X2 [Phycodurus eques]|uniref:uncharacterized protein LOC133408737 isoform X2 n=1 Tax=Phycodurus eques TaxID=693459 RepID=UPI002ACDAEA6|nr:uncharacterized protein LOC133408737 isoform X2 [Phycodurus eques]
MGGGAQKAEAVRNSQPPSHPCCLWMDGGGNKQQRSMSLQVNLKVSGERFYKAAQQPGPHRWANAETCLPFHLSQMNTHVLDFITKAWHLCLFLILYFHLALGGVPGPCRHSVTQEHLRSLNRLIDNQLDHRCFIFYQFTEHLNLSKVCYVKAALPQVLELLKTQFHYGRNSDNRRYVNILEKAIYHLYSQGCISEINEEIEDTPSRLIMMVESTPKEALQKAQHVMQMYMRLMALSTRPVDWNCQSEYSLGDDLNTTQVGVTSTTGEADGGHK